MKTLAIISAYLIIAGCASASYTQNDSDLKYVIQRDVNIYEEDKKEWFLPSTSQIDFADKVLKEQLSVVNRDKVNQHGECPIIDRNLKKYIRQYVGYINHKGEKIILMNMLWKKDANNFNDLNKEFMIVLDGCSHYWKVKVNLDNGELFDLAINGPS